MISVLLDLQWTLIILLFFFSPEVILKVWCNGEHIVVCTKEGNRSGEVTLLTLARPQRDHSSLNTKIAFCQLEVS